MNNAWGELLPLLLLLGHPGSSSASESAGDSGLPVSFDASLSAWVGESVRVSLAHHVDNTATLVGILDRVGSDFIVLRDALASSVRVGFLVTTWRFRWPIWWGSTGYPFRIACCRSWDTLPRIRHNRGSAGCGLL